MKITGLRHARVLEIPRRTVDVTSNRWRTLACGRMVLRSISDLTQGGPARIIMWSALGGVDTGALGGLVGKGLGGLAKLAEDFENNMDEVCCVRQ